ncbi:hypothetical protein L1887_50607 [Cichorium endivia]|nr:hypothetical protein L1887_50607 [Cichorium endivia]
MRKMARRKTSWLYVPSSGVVSGSDAATAAAAGESIALIKPPRPEPDDVAASAAAAPAMSSDPLPELPVVGGLAASTAASVAPVSSPPALRAGPLWDESHRTASYELDLDELFVPTSDAAVERLARARQPRIECLGAQPL